MRNIYKALCFVVLATVLVACPKDDSTPFVIRDRQEVYDENLTEIEAYLHDNYLTVDANMDATVVEIDAGQTSIWAQTTYPLQSITVKNDSRYSVLVDGGIEDDVDYKIYFIVLDEGLGETTTAVDSTFTSYRGWNLSNVTFDENTQGAWSSFPESNVSFISGYRQTLYQNLSDAITPLYLKTAGSKTVQPNGTVTHSDYGNIIVFVPSGLAYFNNSNINIGQYAPICFQIKLLAKRERDHDLDKVKSKYEDINGNGNYFDDDTDGDNLPDFFDVDDDGDGTLTKTEVTKPTTENSGPSLYYPYDAFTIVDDPMTLEDESLKSESKGIPRKFTGPIVDPSTLPSALQSDYTDSARLRRHLDPTSKPPYTN